MAVSSAIPEFEYEELSGVFDTGKIGGRTIGITLKIVSPPSNRGSSSAPSVRRRRRPDPRPLATVVAGGPVTSTALTLLVIPALYKWFGVAREVESGSMAAD